MKRFLLAAAVLLSLAGLVSCAAPTAEPTITAAAPTIPDVGLTKITPKTDAPPDVIAQVTWVAGGGGGGCGTMEEAAGLEAVPLYDGDNPAITIPTSGVFVMFTGTAATREDAQITVTRPDGITSTVPTEWAQHTLPYCWDVIMPVEPGTQIGEYTLGMVAGEDQAEVSFDLVLPSAPVVAYYSDTHMWLAGFQPQEPIRLLIYHDHDSDLIGDFIGYQEIVADEHGMQMIDITGLPYGIVVVAEGSISGSTASTMDGWFEVVGE